MDTGRFLQYRSAHPKHVFASIIESAFSRAQRPCSDENGISPLISDMTNRLSRFEYPERKIRHQWEQASNPQQKIPRAWLATAVVPYKKDTSEAFRRILNVVNVRVVFEPTHSLRKMLVDSKDLISKDIIRNCVYNIPCKDCDAVYVGQTNRELGIRIAENRSLSKRAPRNNLEFQTLNKKSATALHAFDTDHAVDFNHTKILKCGFRTFQERLRAVTIEISKRTATTVNSLNAMANSTEKTVDDW